MYFKTKLKDLLTIGSSNIIASVIGGLFWFYLAKILIKSEYGELGYLISTATVASVVSLLGLGVVVIIYGSKKENVFPPSFVIILISSSISAVVVFFLTQNFAVSILIVGITIFEIILQGILSNQRYGTYSKYFLLRSVTSVVLALIFYQILGLNGILLGYFGSSLLLLKELYPLLKNRKLEFSILRPKIKFMLESYTARLSFVFQHAGDKLLIGSLFGFFILGSFYLAAQYYILLAVIPKSIAQYLLPQESKGKKNKKIKIFSVSIASVITLISIVFVPLGVETFFPTFPESILPMQILSLALIPSSVSVILQTQFLGKENSRIVLIGGILQVGTYFLSIIFLGQSFGLIGIAIGFTTSIILRMVFNLFATMHLRKQKSTD